MPAISLALTAVYLLLAFVWRGYVQWHRTGDSGMRFGTERRWSAQWWARSGFVLAVIASVFTPIAAIVGWVEPLTALDRRPVHVGGLLVSLVGIGSVLRAQLVMGASWRVGVEPGEQTELVVRGAFQCIRNPIFTAMIVTALGLALMVPSWVAVVAVVALIASITYQVVAVEEPHLRATHGSAYTEYCARVGRFVPRLRP